MVATFALPSILPSEVLDVVDSYQRTRLLLALVAPAALVLGAVVISARVPRPPLTSPLVRPLPPAAIGAPARPPATPVGASVAAGPATTTTTNPPRPAEWPAVTEPGWLGPPVVGLVPLPSPPPAAPKTVADPRLASAAELLAGGQVEEAIALLQQVVGETDPTVTAQARFALARARLANGDVAGAERELRQYLSDSPHGSDAARARFVLAQLAANRGDRAAAVPLFEAYLATTTDHTLDGFAYLTLARARQDVGDGAAAIDLFRRAVDAGLPLGDELTAAASVGQSLETTGRGADAAAWYTGRGERPGLDPITRSHYRVLAANALRRGGQSDRAAAIYREVLADAVSPVDTVAAIAALRGLGAAPDDLAVGQALLKSGQFDQAVQVLGDYLDRHAEGADLASARFARGQALLQAKAFDSAVAQLRRFLAEHPTDPRVGEAALLIGQALHASGNVDDAVASLREFARTHPSDPAAPQALSDAIRYLTEDTRPETAVGVEDQLVASFPENPLAPEAAFERGWNAYESLDFPEAKRIWTSVLERWPNAPGSAPALLWLGKLEQRAGNIAAARRLYDLAWKANPGDYYAFRARELAHQDSPGVRTDVVVPSEDVLTRERADLESWLIEWTHATNVDPARPYADAPVGRTGALARIAALAAVGLREDAVDELNQASRSYAADGRSLYALAETAARAGLVPESVAVAYRLLLLSPAPNAYQAPTYLQRLVYPLAYLSLVRDAAAQYEIDPLLLLALMRQESVFNPRAKSSASALGLTQMLPATAAGVAARVGLTDFSTDDLYRPKTAIQLGAAHLAAEVRAFGGNPYLALAAYNAGEGAVRRWLADNPRRDVDLLFEEIPYTETKSYVRNVYRFYREYVALYRDAG